MNKPLTSDQIKTAQQFFGLNPTGVWNQFTAGAWRRMQWEMEGWEPASWVAPKNWSMVFNEMVS